MTVNLARLALLDKLFLVNEAIRVVRLALNNAPTPNEKLDLDEDLLDLQVLKGELTARRNQLAAGAITLPPPSPTVMNEIQALTQQVQQAALDGVATSARLAVVSQVLGLTITLLS